MLVSLKEKQNQETSKPKAKSTKLSTLKINKMIFKLLKLYIKEDIKIHRIVVKTIIEVLLRIGG